MNLPNHTALKEWSNVLDALGRGEQVVLIRKGGLADADFGLEAPRFYLYPTYFHQGESEARRSVLIAQWAEVVRTWRLRELELLGRLEPLVAIPRETLEARYRFRPDQALHVIGLRVWRLPAPVEVKFREEYAGCRSWLSVEEEIDTAASTAVLGEGELQERLAAIDALLAAPV
ncbi:MAG TPA: DUF1802 family protein [Thermoanaerobaculia bacterium]|nr:DUF1802 family protein [Thermoanaerobaculia bacterium]